MGFTLPKYVSGCGCTSGSPYTSEVDVSRNRAWDIVINKPQKQQSLVHSVVTRVFKQTVLILSMGHAAAQTAQARRTEQRSLKHWLPWCALPGPACSWCP